jgi:hypothetical protein
MKLIMLFMLLISTSILGVGQNHLFDNYEKKMNGIYGYNGPSDYEGYQGAFNVLYAKFGLRKYNRKISFNTTD